MASNVNVLCPNGHRVSVKVTPTSSVLHIIEEVCKKKGFDADKFDIKRWRGSVNDDAGAIICDSLGLALSFDENEMMTWNQFVRGCIEMVGVILSPSSRYASKSEQMQNLCTEADWLIIVVSVLSLSLLYFHSTLPLLQWSRQSSDRRDTSTPLREFAEQRQTGADSGRGPAQRRRRRKWHQRLHQSPAAGWRQTQAFRLRRRRHALGCPRRIREAWRHRWQAPQ